MADASPDPRLPDGRVCFVKRWPFAPAGFFAAEANGLAWLAEPGVIRVPDVLDVTVSSIAIEPIPIGAPTESGAEQLGRSLARLHAAGSPSFGASWPGFIGPLEMGNEPSADWPTFYAEHRILPYLRAARDSDAISAEGTRTVERVLSRLREVAGPAADEAPSRIHGDLWSGNLLWDNEGNGWIIDPAAHGGHRETDLAMLALFGTPHIARILAAYDEERPLAEGWRDRVALHQLHPLLVHAVLLGPNYGSQAEEAARWILR
jgi:fructosamine-3-kinase